MSDVALLGLLASVDPKLGQSRGDRLHHREKVLGGKFYAVMGGDGRGVIVEKLLDMVVDYLPAPTDRSTTWGTHPKTGDEIERKHDDNAPFSALAFKITADPFVGKLAYFRVYSGKVTAGSYVLNSSKGEKERVGRIVRLQADTFFFALRAVQDV